jgi:hypothetical protein
MHVKVSLDSMKTYLNLCTYLLMHVLISYYWGTLMENRTSGIRFLLKLCTSGIRTSRDRTSGGPPVFTNVY